MSAIQRSRSAPSVAPPQPFLASHGSDNALLTHRPRIVRHKTSLALTETVSARPAARSGYQTPRTERIEDPFNLGGFFPSHLVGTESPRVEWNWLRGDEADAVESHTEHDEAWSAHDRVPIFDKAEDEETGRVIRREDKLGVLSLRTSFRNIVEHHAACLQSLMSPGGVFTSREATFSSAYDDHLLTPYSEDLPEDSDALYQSYCELRRAHTVKTMADETQTVDGPGRLFSPSPDETQMEDGRWQSAFSAGLGRILGMILL